MVLGSDNEMCTGSRRIQTNSSINYRMAEQTLGREPGRAVLRVGNRYIRATRFPGKLGSSIFRIATKRDCLVTHQAHGGIGPPKNSGEISQLTVRKAVAVFQGSRDLTMQCVPEQDQSFNKIAALLKHL